MNIFVDYVFFKDFTEDGVIRISNTTSDTRVLVSNSSFFNCSSASYGGSIYIYESGSIVQYKVCSYGSKTTNQDAAGSHSYTKVTSDENYKNFVIESSITQNTGHQSVIYFHCGSLLLSSINISDSNIFYNAAFVKWNPSSLSKTNFSNFDNISYNWRCCFYHQDYTHNFYFCNVINNNVLQQNSGIFCP